MDTTISNNGLPKFTPGTSTSTNAASKADGASAAAVASNRTGDDQVKLTDSARALQQAARADDAAPIDSKRVEAVRKALADGSYQIDASRIADRMLTLEQQLGGMAKA